MSFLTETIWSEPGSAARLFGVSVGALLVAFAALRRRAWILGRHIARVPIRIHVAGTRGKSTTTRLIAAILRAEGLSVYAKTTGSEPRVLLPDGSEVAVRRFGTPSIREQGRLMAQAARASAEAVVVECMAIRPEMLWASETLFIRATTLVVTNARPD